MTEREMFEAALELPPENRAAFLDGVCGGDAALRQRLEGLLSTYDQAGSFLEEPVGTGAFAADAGHEEVGPQPESVGQVLAGRYKLLEPIGEGGMGSVWMAQQTEPVKRLVAVKLIKPGMDSKAVLARFEAERQALALMDHPNIAKVHDAGAALDGRPFFVMELVKGLPITKYCDEHRLTPRQRLELFVPVCQALQHAHHKGIIHRDLKPSNVLVARYDDRPVPKVIDFGVAKATGQQLTEQSLHTGFGAIVGTVEYMSPEQASFNQLDVDTRSDLYSLGVLLYELLAGSPPFTRKELEKAGVLEMLRMIREQEPSKPSTKLSTADGLPTLASNRGTEPKKLTALVRGELDWIVMKALEKDRRRRYETANGFAMDVQRYLADEPVLACPPSPWYRLGKFARRNRGKLALAACLLLLVVAIVGSLGWIVRDRTLRREQALEEAKAARADVAQLRQEGKWTAALAVTRRVETLLTSGGADLETRRQFTELGHDLQMAADLEDIRLRKSEVKEEHFDFERAEGEYAAAFRAYGIDVEALEPAEAAERLRARTIVEELTAALDDWASIRKASNAEGAKRLRAVASAADPDPYRNRVREELEHPEGKGLEQLSRSDEVEGLPPSSAILLAQGLTAAKARESALAVLRKTQQRHPGDFWVNHELAMHLLDWKPAQMNEAVGFYRAALALRPDSPGVHVNLGVALLRQGKPTEADAEFRAAIALKPAYAAARDNLGAALLNQRKVADAEAEARAAIRLQPDTASPHITLGVALAKQGKYPEAEAAYREAIRLQPNDARARYNLAGILANQRKLAEAETEFREAIHLQPNDARAHSGLAGILERQGKLSEAETEFREAIRLLPNYVSAHSGLADLLRRQARAKLAESETELGNVIAQNPNDLVSIADLARTLEALRRQEEAEDRFREVVRLTPENASSHLELAHFLSSYFRLAEAVAEFREVIRLEPSSTHAHQWLAYTYADSGQWDKAAAALNRCLELGARSFGNLIYGAVLRLHTDDLEGYRRTCREMLERFGKTNDPREANEIAATCFLAPDAVADLEPALRLADCAATGTEKHPYYRYFLLTRGLGDYRAGRFAGAIEWLKRYSPQVDGEPLEATVLAVTAMAHHRLGQTEEARAALGMAQAILANKMPDPARGRPFRRIWYNCWDKWLYCQVLCREAEKVLEMKRDP